MKSEIILLIVGGILLFVLGFAINGFINSYEGSSNNILSSIKSNNSNCSGMDLMFTAQCLNNELKYFYFFNISQKGKDLNESQLKSEGGVCRNAVIWYNSNFKSLGFQTQEIDLWNLDKTEGHAISLVYDNNLSSYCILDQKQLVGCQNLDVTNKSEVKNES